MGEAPGTYRKVRLMDPTAMTRAVARMAREVVEAEGGTDGVALIGIRTRGVPLAQRLAAEIARSEGARLPVGLLDITLYRDDLTTISSSPVLKRTEINFPVEGKTIVLCDDVLFTGRTVRAAMDGVLDYGRPRKILLAVLVDRGRRELPIEAQFLGKRVSTSATEIISVTFSETDGADDVWLLDRTPVRHAAPKAKAKAKAKAKGRPSGPKAGTRARSKSKAKPPASGRAGAKKAPSKTVSRRGR